MARATLAAVAGMVIAWSATAAAPEVCGAAEPTAEWTLTWLTSTGVTEGDPDLDDDWVVWSSPQGGDHEIYLYDRHMRTVTRLTDNETGDYLPHVSDGRVVWEGLQGPDDDYSTMEVFLYDIAAGETTQLTDNDAFDGQPAIDGDRVAYVGQEGIHLYSVSTKTDRVVAQGGGQYLCLDGDVFAWQQIVGGDRQVAVLELGPGGQAGDTVIVGTIGEWDTDVSVDGNTVVWSGGVVGADQETNEVFSYDVATGVTTQLTDDQVTDFGPSVDGGWVAWSRDYRIRLRQLATGAEEELPEARYSYAATLHGDAVAFLASPPGAGQQDVVLAERGAPSGPLFADVPTGHHYRESIEGMARKGIVAGYPLAGGGAEFRPDASVLRAQFAKMICGALQIFVGEGMEAPFGDLGPDDPEDLYPHDYIAAVADAGITKGTTPTTFAPWDDISRAQVVTMVMRAVGGSMPHPPAGYVGSLGAFDPVHGPHLRQAEYLHMTDALLGFGPGWDPWKPATRAEVAAILWSVTAR